MTTGKRGKRLMAEINVVPYIDVMLVLLVIFMVTAPLLNQGVKIDLPKAGAEALPQQPQKPLTLSIDSEGLYYFEPSSKPNVPLSESELQSLVSAALQRAPETSVLVKADKKVPYEKVIAGMVVLQRAGAGKIGLSTDPRDVPVQRPTRR